MKHLLFLVVFFTAKPANAQRIVLPFSNDWQFSKDNFSFKSKAVAWQDIQLPHTWNVADVMDDQPGYYRGVAWYRKKFRIPKKLQGKDIYLFIGAANQSAAVFVNGKKATEHIGGYTAFSVKLNTYLNKEKENELVIKVNNSYDKNIPPLSADFTFYGGLYRNLQLIAVDPVHFSFDQKGGQGIFISTPVVNNTTATVHIRSHIKNDTKNVRQLSIGSQVLDAAGKPAGKALNTMIAEAGKNAVQEQTIEIAQPALWSPADPYLYKVVTTIMDVSTGKKLDEQEQPLGLRWFAFDVAKGFSLNGKPLKLIGASRHQDFKGMGNAVPDSLARRDVQLLKDMGANFLRVAHYPQDPAVLQACDELGILASVEIPVVNEITETDSFYNNCMLMQQEMIQQYYNHPSVIIWCYMNEILLRPAFANDKERQKKYFASIAMLAKKLDSVTRKEDPYRPTMIAQHGNYNLYREVGLTDIPMIVGWNLYQGWYGANIKDLPVYLDRFHKDYPNKPMMITEYGADADPRIRSAEPVRFDKSVEYATFYHQYYYNEIMQRPFVAGAMVWNLADFNSETRNETMPHINNKGLLEWDRTPKDPYYFYKAMLSTSPFIKILGATVRAAVADSSGNLTQKIQVATNAKQVTLWVDGQQQATLPAETGIATANISFTNGKHTIEAKAESNGQSIADKSVIDFRLQPYSLQQDKAFESINILMGAKRTFADSKGQLWVPGKEYSNNSWGSVAGKAFKLPKGQLPYGTDKNIKGTEDDPVFQTQLTGIAAYVLDVPDGNYSISLCFAELLGGKVEGMVYNLTDGDRTEQASKRIFSVMVNDTTVLEALDIAKEAGSATALVKTIHAKAANGKGISITFKAMEGEPVLNALQVKKMKED